LQKAALAAAKRNKKYNEMDKQGMSDYDFMAERYLQVSPHQPAIPRFAGSLEII
jgi:hypothetical protein